MSRKFKSPRLGWLYLLFFISGFPALLYQVVWQRALFSIYGVNIESVTVVVSAFMLGLGVGSLLGGVVSTNRGLPLLVAFGLIELGTGGFGFCSLRLFHYAALFTAGAGPLETGLTSFFLLVVPTALMGSTLPILVAYLVRTSGSVGSSVASLYSVNTLGSAVACFAAAALTLPVLGASGSVTLAASINTTIGLLILVFHFLQRGRIRLAVSPLASDSDEIVHSTSGPRRLLSLPIALLVSGLAGFISLAYEILWYRAFSWALQGRAPVFPVFLGCYLLGIAFGSLITRGLCGQIGANALQKDLRLLASFTIIANLLAFTVLPATGFLSRFHVVFGLLLVSLATLFLGAVFPLLAEAALKPDFRAGRGLSLVYVSNIVGSTLGSFVVGYVVMDFWSTQQAAVALALAGLVLGAALLLGSDLPRRRLSMAIGITAVVALGIIVSSSRLFDGLYERLEKKRDYVAGYRYAHVVETRSGVIGVTPEGVVIGGGVYDGAFNTDLIHDINGIHRAYALSLLHPAPHQVLMIGLSSGSWAQVIANNVHVEKLSIVEIDRGYLGLIAKYPMVSSLLSNPKVTISIDDGRRWLVAHPKARFDVIVMNMTYSWRAHSSALLSTEFLELARKHLKQNGILFYNTTGSKDVQRTGVTVFPYGVLFGNCLAVSDALINVDVERWRRTIMEYRIDGRAVVGPEDLFHERIAQLTTTYSSLVNAEKIRQETAGARIVTDDNMAPEWADMNAGVALLFRKW
jgi:spermidine synthase